jgi:AraC-like DNA-binding protein
MRPTFKLGGYVEVSPGAGARRCVQAGWIHASRIGAPAAVHRVVPDPCLSVAFSCRRDADGVAKDPKVLFVGPVCYPRFSIVEPGSELVAVRLYPEWSARILDLHPGEHGNAIVDLASVTSAFGEALPDRLGETRSAFEALHILLAAFEDVSSTLPQPSGADGVACQASALLRRTGGRLPMERLAEYVGVTTRHLRRVFIRRVGASPKAVARTLRFHSVLLAADRTTDPDWSDLAVQFGYADQAHMIREFRDLTQMTPATLYRERRSESDSFNLA